MILILQTNYYLQDGAANIDVITHLRILKRKMVVVSK